MPSFTLAFHTLSSKFFLKRNLHSFNPSQIHQYAVVSRPHHSVAAANPSFAADGVATKDLHIDPSTSLSLRIFLPNSALVNPESTPARTISDGLAAYGGYLPDQRNCRKLPVILQFHGGGWVSGGSDTVANDVFCRRMAKACEAVVVAVGYRLAPESRYPAAFEDGVRALSWVAKQVNLAECRTTSVGKLGIVDNGFGAYMAEPWLAAHADPSRCVLLGVSCGANIANYVAQHSYKAGKLLDPIRVVAQVLMYPFFNATTTTKLYNSYLYDESMAQMAWKLFLPERGGSYHPSTNPLLLQQEVPLEHMPPTLTVVADHDWMRDGAIVYSEELRRANVDAPVIEYKNTVHEFATLEGLMMTPQAQACAEDIGIWVKKYVSVRGHEFSY